MYLVRLVLFAAMFTGVFYIGNNIDYDLFFILNSGRYVAEYGLPVTEPFTVHENLPFVMQQWLTNVFFYHVFAAAGIFGLMSLVRMTAALTIVCHYALLRAAGANRTVAATFAAVAGVFLCLLFLRERPQIISTLLLMGQMWVFLKYRASGNGRYLLSLPVISALVVNVHAAVWPMLIVLWLPFFATTFFAGGGKMRRIVLLLAATGIIAGGFFNPYGTELMQYGLVSYGYEGLHEIVGEMAPVDFNNALGRLIVVIWLLSLFVVMRTAVPAELFFLLLGTGCMALSAMRSMEYLLVFGTLAPAYALSHKRFLPLPPTWSPEKIAAFSLAALLPLVGVFGLPGGGSGKDNAQYDVYYRPMAQALAAENLPADRIKIFNGYDATGSYLGFCGYRCYLDTRAEIFLQAINGQKDILPEYLSLIKGKIYYRDFFARYDFTHAIVRDDVSYGALFVELEHDADFELVAQFDNGDPTQYIVYRLYRIRPGAFAKERENAER